MPVRAQGTRGLSAGEEGRLKLSDEDMSGMESEKHYQESRRGGEKSSDEREGISRAVILMKDFLPTDGEYLSE